ncbi:Putative L-ascorbate peroxidase 6 [Linum grandiflorum]
MKPLPISRPNSFFCSSPTLKFPAKSRRMSPSMLDVRCKSVRDSDAGEDCDWVSGRRRRMLVSISTLPFLIGLQGSSLGFNASATDELEPDASELIREEVRKVVTKGRAAGVLRLAFHDAGTFDISGKSGGMNGSIIYELGRPENTGLNKSVKASSTNRAGVFWFLGSRKGQDRSGRETARLKLSWADMIALSGAEAVSICGGPTIPLQIGRMDSVEADAEGRLPEESLDAPGLKQCFRSKGLSTQELVALSGAHTLGSKGFGSPVVFDNSYFKILLEKPWMSSGGMTNMVGLPSDRALVEDDECLRWIEVYASNQEMFFRDFKNAYTKLVNSGATWRSS